MLHKSNNLFSLIVLVGLVKIMIKNNNITMLVTRKIEGQKEHVK